ncbi:hypothetical protein EW146_g2639 [Bondarzewia mesenterica]|uniref:Uncharacterized protein n=1 Tax=Bondarzewia mesenterica TaxID=1095465 RepID=A0A4S4M659_9AGAM|nr:hypothetical protein EW146_g2639 [Bondarzewia mesenterica]
MSLMPGVLCNNSMTDTLIPSSLYRSILSSQTYTVEPLEGAEHRAPGIWRVYIVGIVAILAIAIADFTAIVVVIAVASAVVVDIQILIRINLSGVFVEDDNICRLE